MIPVTSKMAGSLDRDKFRQHIAALHPDGFSLALVTPCHRDVSMQYCMSVYQTTKVLDDLGINHRFIMHQGSSLVDQARNFCVHYFLRSECSHMLFIDSDMGWTSESLLDLLYHVSSQKCIMGGIYPKKKLHLSAMIQAQHQGLDPQQHSGVLDSAMFSPQGQVLSGGLVKVDLTRPVLVNDLPMGFCCISRDVFETMASARTQDWVYDATIGSDMCLFYQTQRHPALPPYQDRFTYWGEDLVFCHKAKALGFECFVLPWLDLEHVGTFVYRQDILRLDNCNMPTQRSGDLGLDNLNYR